MRNTLLLALLFIYCQSIGQTAKEIIDLSIQYHDPENKLAKGDYIYHFDESRPNSSKSKTKVRLAPHKEEFELEYTRKAVTQIYNINKGRVKFSANGNTDLTEEFKKENRISEERGKMMKNYYMYLWQLPMKIKDPGTRIHENVERTSFFDTEALEVKVTYDEEVGKDIWYFYFDPLSYRLVGYRFYHDESANDGEYILLENEYKLDNIKLPAKRMWYTHKEDKFLGTDELVLLKPNSK